MSINWKKPTASMLGRYQPFHDGHKALFKEILKRTGQVIIMIRDTSGTDDSNPFDFDIVKKNIEKIFWNLREINIDLGVKFNNFSLSSNREMWNIKSAIMKLQQGQIVLHKQIKQLNKIVKKKFMFY